ncbi:hypothetical protein [Candidatus Phytoplasma australiense]|uniref:Uncharacterized protein n=1 Tax=Strawberry lethal yellows phytoplasma (CPA) str. NZSb11 TaxID=980422 RepID=R4RXH5_PHYAS|nr:hypothetical protein [Candidatus Phytoplasma australiense]AGL90597.1 Hypothetical Protein SLY_0682 [Strawberry lethal yellows phytoplasma (CPA) str. NZSb11]
MGLKKSTSNQTCLKKNIANGRLQTKFNYKQIVVLFVFLLFSFLFILYFYFNSQNTEQKNIVANYFETNPRNPKPPQSQTKPFSPPPEEQIVTDIKELIDNNN